MSLATGASQTFTASGGSGLGYVWSFVQNESGGTLTASGDYQAGPVGGVTDVVQVVDSFANSATATVDVTRQSSAVSAAAARTSSMGCGTTGGAALPWLAGAILGLLGARSVRRPRRARESVEPRRRLKVAGARRPLVFRSTTAQAILEHLRLSSRPLSLAPATSPPQLGLW